MLIPRIASLAAGAFVALCLCAAPGLAADEDHGAGLIFTPPDELRGIPLASSPYSGADLPPMVDLSDRMPPPGDQGRQESCVAWAIAYALKSYQENIELHWGFTSNDHVFSPSYIYNQINNGQDGGSLFTDALNLLSSQGVAPMSAMPYSDADYRTQPSEAARAAARKYRIDTWRQVNPRDIREVKAQLNAGYPVIFGIVIDDGFRALSGPAVWKSAYGKKGGGHALLAVGYDDSRNAIKFLNSWGPAWGDHGYGWMDYGFFRTVVQEAYVAKDATDSAPPPPPVQPVNPVPAPPPVASNATFAVTSVEHNVVELGLVGMKFTGTLDVLDKLTGALQIVINVVQPDGGTGTKIRSVLPAYASASGEVATGTPLMTLQGSEVHTKWSAFLPYSALSIQHGIRIDLNAVPTLYINKFGVRSGTPIAFFVLYSDTPDGQYYFDNHGKPAGPMTLSEIGAIAEAGAIHSDTLVWKPGLPNWMPAANVPELAALLPVPRTNYFESPDVLFGTWLTDAVGPPGTAAAAKLTVSLQKDGNVTGTYEYVPANATTPVRLPVSGNWWADAIDPKRFNVTMNLVFEVDGQPRATNTTVELDVIDNDTLRNPTDGTVTRRVSG